MCWGGKRVCVPACHAVAKKCVSDSLCPCTHGFSSSFVAVLYHLEKECLSVLPLPKNGILQTSSFPVAEMVRQTFPGFILH